MQSIHTTELWHRCLKGDRDAFGLLFEMQYAALYHYGLRLVGGDDPRRVEDVIHNVFLRLWERRNRLGQAQSVIAYLMSALRRELLRGRRGKSFFARTNWKSVEERPGEFAFCAETLLVRRETEELTREVVADMLNQLSLQQREIVYLRYFSNLSYTDTAAVMALEYQSVVNLHHRALGSLRRNLKNRPALFAYLAALRAS